MYRPLATVSNRFSYEEVMSTTRIKEAVRIVELETCHAVTVHAVSKLQPHTCMNVDGCNHACVFLIADHKSYSNLLKDRALLRHFKAVDPETGEFLGYARWKLPPGYQNKEDGSPTWPEGQVPDVTTEERAKIEEVADAADWEPDTESDELDAPITRRKIEYLARKEYLRKHFEFHFFMPVVQPMSNRVDY